MPEESTRRLAAIMMGDIAGYSRLMGADERGTHVRVQRVLRELVDPTITEHRGRVIRTRGDGFLAMFDSPVEAVRCAIVIQQSMVGRNLELPDAQWIRFRIGVNLGDVIVEPDDIYGEGVNVAARLEQLAEPGNIYISGGVYEQIRYKLVCGYQSLGDRKVKNILDPVPIYRVLPDPAAVATAARRKRAGIGLFVAGTLVVAAVAGAGWYGWQRASERSVQSVATTTRPASSQPVPAPPAAPPAMEAEHRAPPAPLQAIAGADPSPPDTPSTPGNSAPAPPGLGPLPTALLQAAAVPPRLQIGSPEPAPGAVNPEMVPVPGGTFRMGSNEDPSEEPPHKVTIRAFLLAK